MAKTISMVGALLYFGLGDGSQVQAVDLSRRRAWYPHNYPQGLAQSRWPTELMAEPGWLWNMKRDDPYESSSTYPYTTPFTFTKMKLRLMNEVSNKGAGVMQRYAPIYIGPEEYEHAPMSFAQAGWKPSADLPMEETTNFEKSQQAAFDLILKKQERQRNEYEQTAKRSVNEMKKDFHYARNRWTGV